MSFHDASEPRRFAAGTQDAMTGLSELNNDEREVIRRFHQLYYRRWQAAERTIELDWLGVRLRKCPLDLWIYQELIHRRRPDLIVETGTFKGGSALYLASLCELVGHGRVVTIDVTSLPASQRPVHPRLDYLTGSSVDPVIVASIATMAAGAEEVMVILDSDHATPHVYRELTAYAPLVRPGGYLIVEDTNVNGHPVLPEHGPGPREAVALFLARHAEFAPDRHCERLLMTLNPGGFLRRRTKESADG